LRVDREEVIVAGASWFETRDGTHLHYLDAGRGPTVVARINAIIGRFLEHR
jgi:hypothetical protein